MAFVISALFLLVPFFSHGQSFSGSEDYSARVIFSGLSRGWGVRFSPDGRLFVTEKTGRIHILENGRYQGELQGIPTAIHPRGQGGLMDILFHNDFDTNGFVYLSYSTRANARPFGGVNTRVSRFVLDGDRLTSEEILIQGGYGTDNAHFGGALAMDRDNFLYATFGERHNKELAQDLSELNGKVVRLKDDGQVPNDNPFADQAGAHPAIWTYGHRNSQGIDIHPVTGQAFVSEHGPSSYDAHLPQFGNVGKADEVNALIPGKNYGWPTLFGDPEILPWTAEMFEFAERPDVEAPYREFTIPDGIAPAGATFYSSNVFASWENSFFVAALRGYLVRVSENGSGEVEVETILPRGYTRLRDVVTGPNGFLYVVNNNQVIEIRPTN